MQTKLIALPFKRSSHRQIVDADGNLIVQVFSGGCGIEAADAIEELIVRACNAHDDLVKALQALVDTAGIMDRETGETREQEDSQLFADARAALAKAGAA